MFAGHRYSNWSVYGDGAKLLLHIPSYVVDKPKSDVHLDQGHDILLGFIYDM